MNYFKIGEELLKAALVVIQSTRHPYHEAHPVIKALSELEPISEEALDKDKFNE